MLPEYGEQRSELQAEAAELSAAIAAFGLPAPERVLVSTDRPAGAEGVLWAVDVRMDSATRIQMFAVGYQGQETCDVPRELDQWQRQEQAAYTLGVALATVMQGTAAENVAVFPEVADYRAWQRENQEVCG